MGKPNAEQSKEQSRHLRGTIAEDLQRPTSHMDEANVPLLKFHGSYQQDDRDLRAERLANKQEKAHFFMVRSKIPGGDLTADQYLAHHRISEEFGNGTLRITSRQGFQTHAILKGDLPECIARINASGITTWGACGDVVRNLMATPVPLATPAHREILRLAKELAAVFAAKSRAYSEIWLDGEKLTDPADEEEPIYGDAYLPRKFKIGIAIPPRNDIDVYANDLGFVPEIIDGDIRGYTVLVGGGMGMTHGKSGTFPALAQPLFHVRREDAVATAIAVVTAHRDHGGRTDRKHARLKYVIADHGLEWFRSIVLERMSAAVEEPRPLKWTTVSDMLGWHEQGDGRLFCGVFVQEGRIKDVGPVRHRSGLKAIAERLGLPIRLTANCNFYLHDIDPSLKSAVDKTLAEFGIPHTDSFTEVRKTAMACVALPTCGLALAESERVFSGVLDEIDETLRDLGLAKEEILIRMTGCPNGCARPYNADFGIVGRSPGKYAVYIGGSHTGERLGGLVHRTVDLVDIPGTVRRYLVEFVENRQGDESFSDFWARTREAGPRPDPEQFHVELEERAARLAEAKAGGRVALD
jgi:sulfite reductase (ferredoxin)